MKIFKLLLVAIALLLVAFVGVGLLLSPEFEVDRAITIRAEPAQIHALVGDLERWEEWTPWKEVDPSVVTTLGSQTTGIGAHQSWTDRNGGGELTFTDSSLERGVAYDMLFFMGETNHENASPATGQVRYRPVDGGTEVRWTMQGSMPFPVVGGYFAKLMPGSIGGMFEIGLEKLKKAAEAEPVPAG